jgi:hypothetical protein
MGNFLAGATCCPWPFGASPLCLENVGAKSVIDVFHLRHTKNRDELFLTFVANKPVSASDKTAIRTEDFKFFARNIGQTAVHEH